MMLDQNLIDP